ncbi:hypothetical protein chiPu_0002848 [Chiloscyllium punctatum]|uniref:Uncharacterized protein n=1 Tax=Chiloscyllium punctatum TaxID=137246 RepID=A0A401S238_CHIPU|nr:hypothetical protein [Chiloscyllium punctatum]
MFGFESAKADGEIVSVDEMLRSELRHRGSGQSVPVSSLVFMEHLRELPFRTSFAPVTVLRGQQLLGALPDNWSRAGGL